MPYLALSQGLEDAFKTSGAFKGGAPSQRIAYRAILLDRTLRGLGITEDEPAPPEVLQEVPCRGLTWLDSASRG